MKVMVMVKAAPSSEAGVMPSEQLLREMGAYNDELVKAGIMLAGEGLHPSSAGKRVAFRGEQRTVIDGPFAETKELVAGFWLWKVNSMDEAVEWVKRCPNPQLEDSEIEIRRVFEAKDFGKEYTPELREQASIQRALLAGLPAPRFENAPARFVAGINESYTQESRKNIPDQWRRFVPFLGAVPGQVGADAYGVCWNAQPHCNFDYLTGVAVESADNLPDSFAVVELPAGRYAVFPHAGHVSELPRMLEILWTQWAPSCELELAQTPCFERYTSEFNGETGIGGMEVWAPLAG